MVGSRQDSRQDSRHGCSKTTLQERPGPPPPVGQKITQVRPSKQVYKLAAQHARGITSNTYIGTLCTFTKFTCVPCKLSQKASGGGHSKLDWLTGWSWEVLLRLSQKATGGGHSKLDWLTGWSWEVLLRIIPLYPWSSVLLYTTNDTYPGAPSM
jgi:hypothetical protein